MSLTLFMVLAAIAIVSALGVIFNKNVVHSALSLLLNFCTLSVFYFMLNAQFLGIVQILVYAGAIVVLFLFVVMLLGAELGEEVTNWLNPGNIFVIVLSLVLLTVVGTAVFENANVFDVTGKTGDLTQETIEQYGQTQAVSRTLLTEYVLPFELASVLLLVGIVGVIWLARPPKKPQTQEGNQ
ncbi:MAG: NADH-quinone oxidoreductase subunit J [Chloroflexota bacterium]